MKGDRIRLVSIKQEVEIPAPPAAVYAALVDADKHAEFTGSPATSDPRVGGKMSAWGDYISGEYLQLDPPKRILQTWRTSEWPEGCKDSLLEITLVKSGAGTRLHMLHSKVPADQAPDYEQGWTDYYWEPLRAYFDNR